MNMRIGRRSKGKRLAKLFLFFLFFLLIGGGGYSYFVFFEDEQPEIKLINPPKYVGDLTEISFTITDTNSGIRSVQTTIEQKEKEKLLYNKEFDRMSLTGQMGPKKHQRTVTFDSKRSKFTEGQATIRITVHDYSLRGFFKGNTAILEHTVTIDTKPPKIHLLHNEHYIKPGGTGIVIYRLTGDATKHGVYIDKDFHRGSPTGDGRNDVFIAYFALPFNAKKIKNPSIFASDAAGNETKVPFAPIFQKSLQKSDRINVGDGFLSSKIPEFEQYYPEMSGNQLEKYIFTNNEVRTRNNKKIFELCQNSQEKRLWEGAFTRMAGASKAGFADHRTYYYKNKPIDKQVHLGMDIASTKRAAVKAANRGKVIFADYLGIYGHTVILDHGQGVFSLYSHLSQIQVATDDLLEQGVTLGLTGTSGMAGGDHLHFSMLINGIFVTPKEWWDQNWIEVTITSPLVDSKF